MTWTVHPTEPLFLPILPIINVQKTVVIEEGASHDSLDIHDFTIVDGGKSAIMTMEKNNNEMYHQ
jgi:hypothetical protein